MSTACSLSCSCGAMTWQIDTPTDGRHIICYCADCQSYANHLEQSDAVLEDGGTHIFQTLPHHVTFLSGAEHLALLRLSPKGLFRWYASCCNTPIANTLPKASFPFVGAILPVGHSGFGRPSARVNTKDAPIRIRQTGMTATVYGIFFRAAKAALAGQAKHSAFFDEAGQPVVQPLVISKEQRAKARPKHLP